MRSFSKYTLTVVAMMLVAVVAAACGNNQTPESNNNTSGTAADAVRTFITAAFSGNEEAAKAAVCSASQGQLDQAISSLTTISAAGGEVDTSALTYTVASETGDDAVVNVSGNLKMTIADTTRDFPLEAPYPAKKENGAWKVCGF